METFVKVSMIFLLTKLSYAGKSVEILTSGGLNPLEDDDILRVLSHNKSSSLNNFTLVELIGHLRNYSIEPRKEMWRSERYEHTNPFYGEF